MIQLKHIIPSLFLAFAAHAQVLCKWDAESTRNVPARFDCFRGETLVFQPTFHQYGTLVTNATYTLQWQTNGMGTAYWSTNILQFTPAMDVGASAYTVFIRAETTNGISYRANAKIKMLGSPGAVLNALPLPVQSIDFATTSYTNAPWMLSASFNTANWDTAYGWGNHAGLYRPIAYVPTWSEVTGKPTEFAPSAHNQSYTTITDAPWLLAANLSNSNNWNSAYGWGNHAGLYRPIAYVPTWEEVTGKPTVFAPDAHSQSYTTITDAPWLLAANLSNSNNWNAAYGWGDHAGLYRLIGWVPGWDDVTNKPTSFTPSAHNQSYTTITDAPWALATALANSNNWNAAYGWGDHAGLYRLIGWVPGWDDVTNKPTSFTPSAHNQSYTTITDAPWALATALANSNNWNAAYAWGNHAGLYRLIEWVPGWDDVTNKPTSFTPSAHNQSYTTITDSPWALATALANSNNWNAAYGWGDHAGLYRLIEWVPGWDDVTNKPTSFTPSAHNQSYTTITDAPWATTTITNGFATIAYADSLSTNPPPYMAFTGNITPANGTATVTYAHGIMPRVILSGATVITLDPASFGTNGISRISLSLYSGTNSVTLATNVITYATMPTLSTNKYNTILIRRVANDPFEGRQL